MRIISWNVNGYRAAWKKGWADWLASAGADVVGIQETKAWPEQLSEEQLRPLGWHSVFAQAEKKGYSGVATFSKKAPSSTQVGFGDPPFDTEGRVVITEHEGVLLANIYFPNGKRDEIRLRHKMDFYEKTLTYFSALRSAGKKIVVCGDYNSAHREIDLARPKENENVSGFLPEERAWIDRWINAGFVDVFRRFHPDKPEQYTWWDQVTRARERNVGWRIDYHFVSDNLVNAITDAWISPDVMGSDHCPVGIEVDLQQL